MKKKSKKRPYIEMKIFDPLTYALLMDFKGELTKEKFNEVKETVELKFGERNAKKKQSGS